MVTIKKASSNEFGESQTQMRSQPQMNTDSKSTIINSTHLDISKQKESNRGRKKIDRSNLLNDQGL